MRHSVCMRGLILALGLLAGCGSPLDKVGRLSEIELAEDAPVAGIVAPENDAETPLLQPEPKSQARGLFGFGRSSGATSGGDEAPPDVPPGTLLSFGEVKPVCNLPKARRGKEIAAFPDNGRGGYRLYDSVPGKDTPHPFYVTGFADGCARTFTAAVAVFGSPGMHELLRYGLPAKVQPYSRTDEAYETLKSRICRVARNKPCGDKVSRLERNTVFVSAYEKYGDNARWFNVLLHAGEIEATDVKGGS